MSKISGISRRDIGQYMKLGESQKEEMEIDRFFRRENYLMGWTRQSPIVCT